MTTRGKPSKRAASTAVDPPRPVRARKQRQIDSDDDADVLLSVAANHAGSGDQPAMDVDQRRERDGDDENPDDEAEGAATDPPAQARVSDRRSPHATRQRGDPTARSAAGAPPRTAVATAAPSGATPARRPAVATATAANVGAHPPQVQDATEATANLASIQVLAQTMQQQMQFLTEMHATEEAARERRHTEELQQRDGQARGEEAERERRHRETLKQQRESAEKTKELAFHRRLDIPKLGGSRQIDVRTWRQKVEHALEIEGITKEELRCKAISQWVDGDVDKSIMAMHRAGTIPATSKELLDQIERRWGSISPAQAALHKLVGLLTGQPGKMDKHVATFQAIMADLPGITEEVQYYMFVYSVRTINGLQAHFPDVTPMKDVFTRAQLFAAQQTEMQRTLRGTKPWERGDKFKGDDSRKARHKRKRDRFNDGGTEARPTNVQRPMGPAPQPKRFGLFRDRSGARPPGMRRVWEANRDRMNRPKQFNKFKKDKSGGRPQGPPVKRDQQAAGAGPSA